MIAPTLLGLGEDAGRVERDPAALVRLADHAVGDLDLRRQVERRVRGVTTPSSSAAATVNALKVEPGS